MAMPQNSHTGPQTLASPERPWNTVIPCSHNAGDQQTVRPTGHLLGRRCTLQGNKFQIRRRTFHTRPLERRVIRLHPWVPARRLQGASRCTMRGTQCGVVVVVVLVHPPGVHRNKPSGEPPRPSISVWLEGASCPLCGRNHRAGTTRAAQASGQRRYGIQWYCGTCLCAGGPARGRSEPHSPLIRQPSAILVDDPERSSQNSTFSATRRRTLPVS